MSISWPCGCTTDGWDAIGVEWVETISNDNKILSVGLGDVCTKCAREGIEKGRMKELVYSEDGKWIPQYKIGEEYSS